MARAIARHSRRGQAPRRAAARTGAVARRAHVSVRIRLAEPGDAEVLARLRHQIEQTHARLLPDYFRAPQAAPAVLLPRGPGTAVLVAEAQDRRDRSIVGYVALRVVETPPDPSMTPRRRVHVDAVVVDELHREVGVGTALMRAAADWARARDVTELVLTVWSENRPAEKMYRQLGYLPIAQIFRRLL